MDMNRRVLASMLAMLALFVCSAPLASANAQDKGYQVSNLPGPTGGVEWGRVEGVLEAPASDVLEILHDYAKYAGLFPYFQTTKVLSQRGSDAIVYLEAKVLHGAATLWGQVRMRSAQENGVEVIDVKMMKGKSNVAEFLARWEVTPMDDGQRTKVAFQLLVDPDLPVPDALVSNEMKRSVDKAFRSLRKRTVQMGAVASRTPHAM
jgi:ribosome-associated toxin RatA of RatAB toxin-antitoxin module